MTILCWSRKRSVKSFPESPANVSATRSIASLMNKSASYVGTEHIFERSGVEMFMATSDPVEHGPAQVHANNSARELPLRFRFPVGASAPSRAVPPRTGSVPDDPSHQRIQFEQSPGRPKPLAIILGGGSNTYGIVLERSSLVSAFHFETPPMGGEPSA